jgi:hypothetical protein
LANKLILKINDRIKIKRYSFDSGGVPAKRSTRNTKLYAFTRAVPMNVEVPKG